MSHHPPVPEPIDDLLGRILERAGASDAVAGARILEEWDVVAGAQWAGRTRPVSLRDGVLLVETARGGDAAVLRYHCGELVSRIAARWGEGLVHEVRLRVARSPW